MIELLGIGVPSRQGQWLFRGLCARIERPEVIAVVASDPEARLALLDAVTARRIPAEGRVWVNGHPLTTDTVSSYRSRVVEVDLHAKLTETRSLLANVRRGPRAPLRMLHRWRDRLSARSRLAAEETLVRAGLQRLANERVGELDPAIRRRGLIAQALMSKPDVLVVREVERDLSLSDAADVLAALRVLVACDRLTVFVSTAETILVQMFAERVLAIADGQLRFNGPPSTSMAVPASMVSTRATERVSAQSVPAASR
jgi:phosphonate transport system ATP-binding protein